MANIILKDLVKYDLSEGLDSASFIHNLSEEQINLRGGLCAFPTDESMRGCSDVIIDFPQKFDLIKFFKKRK
jgi:hypothetical protein